MSSIRMSPNSREVISAISTITGKQEYLSSTNNILNVNATVSISGSALPISGATTAIVTAIVDSSGNQISTFGGGTQYTDGGTPPTHPIGNTIEWSDGSNWQTVSTAKPLPVSATFSPSGTQDVNLKQVGATTVLTGNGAAGAGAQRVTIASDNTAFSVNATLSAGSNAIGTVGTTSAVVNVGQKTVNTSAVQISASSTIPVNGIIIRALSTNAASVFVGGSGVTTSTGFELVAGESMSFTANLNTLYIISVASTTDKICYNVE